MRRTMLTAAVLSVVATACGGATGGGTGDVPLAGGDDLLPRCSELEEVAPRPEDLRDTPLYVGNEQPIEEVQAWASSHAGFAEIWIDRDANGWLVVGFTQDVEEARAEAAELFPDDGVAVVEVPRGLDELLALQEQVHERSDLVQGSSSNVRRGVVEVFVPTLSDDVHAELSAEFADDPVCVDGGDPADAVPPGDQPTEGDGWRLLAAEQGGAPPFRTGIATTPDQVEAALVEAGVPGLDVDLDLQTEVLVWFGEAYGSSCPDRRLDGIVVDTEPEPVLRPVIVDPTDPGACTDDLAGAWAFVVAVERAVLPAGPFTIRLTDRTPPIQDEATFVDGDLTAPGASVADDAIAVPEPDPKDSAARDGDIIETGFATDYVLYVHCGAGSLGFLNDVFWVAEDDSLRYAAVPEPWRDLVDEDEEVVVSVLLESGDPPTATATANGFSVTYVPGQPDEYGCD